MRNDLRKKIFPLILTAFLIGTMTPVYSAENPPEAEARQESLVTADLEQETAEKTESAAKNETEVPKKADVEESVKEEKDISGSIQEETAKEEPEIPEIIGDEEEQEQPIEETKEAEKFHHDHNDKCGYIEAQDEIPCDKECTQLDQDGNIVHSKDCAYRPAVEEQPCKYEVEVQKKLDGLEADEAILKELQEEIEAKKAAEEKARLEAEKAKEQPPVQEEKAAEPKLEESKEPEDSKAEIKPEEAKKSEEIKKSEELPKLEAKKPEKNDEAGEETSKESVNNKKESTEDVKKDSEKQISDTSDTIEKDLEEEKNDAKFYVSVPSAVTLTGDTDSFDIETSKEGDLPEGDVLITVEGTESYDDDSFALCHESDESLIWRYRLQIADQMVDKVHNEILIPGTEAVQKAVIVPTDSYELMLPGLYSGSITFHVEYREAETK